MIDAETVERITAELHQIIQIIAQETGLTSHWSGHALLDSEVDVRGTKPYNCDVLLRADLAFAEERWRTLIHEALHCFSEGYNPVDYMAHRGWEEGVVEQLQRLLRPAILGEMGITVEEVVFQKIEATHSFNIYIEALEEIREAFGRHLPAFYIDLLRTPIRQRYALLVNEALQLKAEKRKAIVALLSKCKETLDGRV